MHRKLAIAMIASVLGISTSQVDAASLSLSNTLDGSGYFGGGVSLWGDTTLVGAAFAESAHLYSALDGSLLTTFQSPAPEQGAFFGRTVKLYGTQALISAHRAGAQDEGAVYLFDTVTGALLQTFNNPQPRPYDFFGLSALDLTDNMALIGALGDVFNPTGSGPGWAYLYDTTTGLLKQTFSNPTPADGDYFGSGVAMWGNHVLVSASGDDTGAIDSGSAYLFDGTTGSLVHTFKNPSPAAGDRFGEALALYSNFALIGAAFDDTAGVDSGAAYLFDVLTGNLLQTFLNPDPSPNDRFGQQFSIFGNYALISAFKDNNDMGAAFLYDITSGALLQTIASPNGGNFGLSVALSDKWAIIGAPTTSSGGSTYIYRLDTSPAPIPLPATLPLALAGLFGVLVAGSRRRRLR